MPAANPAVDGRERKSSGSSMAKKLGGFMAPRGTMKSLIGSITITSAANKPVNEDGHKLLVEETTESFTEDDTQSEASAISSIAAAAAAKNITKMHSSSSSGNDSDAESTSETDHVAIGALLNTNKQADRRRGTIESRRRSGSSRNLRLDGTKRRPSMRRVKTEHPDQEPRRSRPDMRRSSTDNGHGPKPTLRRVEKPPAAATTTNTRSGEEPKHEHPLTPNKAHSSGRHGRSSAASSHNKKEREVERHRSSSRRRKKVKDPKKEQRETLSATSSSSSDLSMVSCEKLDESSSKHHVKMERRYSTGSTDGNDEVTPKRPSKKSGDPRRRRSKSCSRKLSSKQRSSSSRCVTKQSGSHTRRREAAAHHLRNSGDGMADSSERGEITKRDMSKGMSLRDLGVSAHKQGSNKMSKRMSLRDLGVSVPKPGLMTKNHEQNQSMSALDLSFLRNVSISAIQITGDTAKTHARRSSTTLLPENLVGVSDSTPTNTPSSNDITNSRHKTRPGMSDGSGRRSNRNSSRNLQNTTPALDAGKAPASKGHNHHHHHRSSNGRLMSSDHNGSTPIDGTIQEEESVLSNDDESTLPSLELPKKVAAQKPLSHLIKSVTAMPSSSCSISTMSSITKDSVITEARSQDATQMVQDAIRKYCPQTIKAMTSGMELGHNSFELGDSRPVMAAANRNRASASCSNLGGMSNNDHWLQMSLQSIGEGDEASVEEMPMTFDTKPMAPQRNATSSSTIDQMNLFLQQHQAEAPKAPRRASTNANTLDAMNAFLQEYEATNGTDDHEDGPENGDLDGGEQQFNGLMTALESLLLKGEMAAEDEEEYEEDIDLSEESNVEKPRRRMVRRHSLESASGCSFVPEPKSCKEDDDRSKKSSDDLDLHRRLATKRLNFASQRLKTLSRSKRTLSTGRAAGKATAVVADDCSPRKPQRSITPGSVAAATLDGKAKIRAAVAAKRNANAAPRKIQRPKQTLSDGSRKGTVDTTL